MTGDDLAPVAGLSEAKQKETITLKVRFGDWSNGGRFSYCGEGAVNCATGEGSGDSA